MSQIMVAMDAQLEPSGELELPTLEPFGHRVMHLQSVERDYCIVSEGRGLMGYFQWESMAQPFLRMLTENAYRGRGRLDFRLWRWDAAAGGWAVAQRTIPLAAERSAA